MVFNAHHLEPALLRRQAFNLRWAEQPSDVIPLTAADLDLPVAAPIVDAIKNAADKHCLNYGPATGLPALKQAISKYYLNKRNVIISADQILPVNSAAYGISLTCQTILQPGDEAIVFDPVDFLFAHSVEAAGARVVRFSIPPGNTHVDFSAMKSLITSKTRMICLCNPLNPTGKVFTREELQSMASIALEHQLYILSDEIWSDIVYMPNVFTSIASLGNDIANQTITITGFSKSHGLAGLRIGSVMTNNTVLFQKILHQSGHLSTVHGVSTISQIAGTAALNECEQWLDHFLQHLHRMRDLVVQKLNLIPGVQCIAPEGCYVAFADIRETGMSSTQIHELLLQRARVAVVPGLPQWFGPGAEGYIRISFASSEQILSESLSRIHQTLSRL